MGRKDQLAAQEEGSEWMAGAAESGNPDAVAFLRRHKVGREGSPECAGAF